MNIASEKLKQPDKAKRRRPKKIQSERKKPYTHRLDGDGRVERMCNVCLRPEHVPHHLTGELVVLTPFPVGAMTLYLCQRCLEFANTRKQILPDRVSE